MIYNILSKLIKSKLKSDKVYFITHNYNITQKCMYFSIVISVYIIVSLSNSVNYR